MGSPGWTIEFRGSARTSPNDHLEFASWGRFCPGGVSLTISQPDKESSPMRLTVLLFAGLRQRAGRAEVLVEIDPTLAPTLADLRRTIAQDHPELGSIDHCRIAIDQEFARDDHPLAEGQEIALIPPVSGGSGAELEPDPASALESWTGTRSRLTRAALSLSEVVAAVEHRDAGGIATFTGNVREHSRGKQVVRLEYEAYPAMALRVMDAIASAVEQEIPGARVAIAHRIGTLVVGETAVVIAASAPHRDEAFRACRETIERLKQDVPIWKKEIDDRGGEWIGRGP
ncbi:molybdenum cofactor biosynthesis protein [Nannocystaceae bacterium ST9]